jgi:hypothetical protein
MKSLESMRLKVGGGVFDGVTFTSNAMKISVFLDVERGHAQIFRWFQ